MNRALETRLVRHAETVRILAVPGALISYAIVRTLLCARHPALLDDAYITLRYVRNALEHGALVYEPGVSIYALTTISYPLLLFALASMVSAANLELLTHALNIGLECATAFVAFRLLVCANVPRLAAVPLALAVVANVPLQSASQGGMETTLFTLMLFLTCLWASRSPNACASAAGLAFLTRPEGIIVIAVIGLSLLRNRARSLSPIAILITFGLFYMGFLYLGYGTLLPASVTTKAGIETPEFASARYLATSASGLVPISRIPGYLRLWLVVALSIWGAIRWPRKGGGYVVAVAFSLAFPALYAIANPPMWFWYAAPWLTLLSLAMAYATYDVASRLSSRPAGWTACVAVVVTAIGLRAAHVAPDGLLDLYTRRVVRYRALVESLQREYGLDASSSILTHEIGAIGFYSDARICDAVGLVNPQWAALGRANEATRSGYGYCTRELIEVCDPDFLVFQRALYHPSLSNWPGFKDRYRHRLTFEGTAFDARSGDVDVYSRARADEP